MKYKLKPLDQLIGNQEPVSEEVEQIISELSQTAYSLRSTEEIILFLQNHQTALLKRRNTEVLRGKSDEILFFLETGFEAFLNETLPISDRGKQQLSTQWSAAVAVISKNLSTVLNPKLLNLVRPLTDLESHYDYSIYEVRFIANFWKNWHIDFNTPFETYTEENVIRFLITNNFNTPAFFNFIIGQITGELHHIDDPATQRQVLESHAKRFRLIPVRVSNCYCKDFPSIHQLIENWLTAELKECRKKQKTYNPQQQTLTQALTGGQKIETSLSVAQLAYMFKLCNKTGIVTNSTQMEILQAVINTYKTKKVDTIALESLHNKYYNIEDRTRESVRELLQKMIRAIE